MIWLGISTFLIFGILNMNDPDWFIWVPLYCVIAIMPIIPKNILDVQAKKIISMIFFILGVLIFLKILDTSFYYQTDDKMISLWEYQREGLGLILGSIWIYYKKK